MGFADTDIAKILGAGILSGFSTLPMGTSGLISGGTTGSVLFLSPASALTQDNANFFWDNTNKRLGIGTNTPVGALHIGASVTRQILLNNATTGYLSTDGTYIGQSGLDLYIYNQESSGNVYLGTGGTADVINISQATQNVRITASGAATKGFVIKGAAAQTANLQEWQNSSGTALISIGPTGNITTADTIFGTNQSTFVTSIRRLEVSEWMTLGQFQFQTSGSNAFLHTNTSYGLQLGQTGTPSITIAVNTGGVTVNGFTSSTVGLTVKGAASQTANLQEWQNSSGTAYGYVDIQAAGSVLNIVNNGVDNGSRKDGINVTLNGGTNTSAAAGYFDSQNRNTCLALQTVGKSSFGGTLNMNNYGILNLGNTTIGEATSSTNGNLRIADLTSTFAGGNGGQIVFSGDERGQGVDVAAFASIRGIKENGSYLNSLGALVFYTQSNSGAAQALATATEKARISSAGNFLINGFTAATVGLTVKGAAAQSASLQEWQNSSGSILALINATGGATFNEQGNDTDFRVESDTKTHALFVDASANAVGFDQSAPTAKIHIGAGGTAAGTAPLKLTTQASGLSTVEQGIFELIGNSLQFAQYLGRRGVVQSQATITTPTTLANSTTESSAIITVAHGANYFEVGKCEEIVLRGIIQQTATGSGQLQVRVKYAGTTISTITTVVGAIAANTPFEIRVSMTVITLGATGTLQFNSVLWMEGVTSNFSSAALPTVDTTTLQSTTVTLQWTVADVGNTITVHQGRCLVIEPNK